MESLRNIELRRKSVRNINQITKAMEVVAATKMRRSQEIALSSRPYAWTALDMLGTLSRLGGIELPPVLLEREVKKTALVVVTSDKGLAGAFNSAVFREFTKFVKDHGVDLSDDRYSFIAVGQKAANFLTRNVHAVEASFTRFGDFTTSEEVKPLSELLVSGFLGGRWDEVIVFSTHFRTALKQEVVHQRVLPVDFESIRETTEAIVPETGRFAEERRVDTSKAEVQGRQELDYLIEPSPKAVLEALAEHLVEMEIYHLVLEANASEHAARRAAMKSASDNAADLAERLTLEYNKSRQAAVTREIIEITAGAEALTS